MQRHIGYYLLLLLILIMGALLITQNQYGKNFQMVAAAMTTFCYIIWGIVHHYLHHDISAKIVIEYVLMGSVGLTVIFFLVQGI